MSLVAPPNIYPFQTSSCFNFTADIVRYPFLPIDKRIIYKDREINDFIQKHGWGCIGEIDIRESMEEKEKYASKRIDIYTDTLLYIFKKLYNSETKTVSPNFLLHYIGEATYN